MERLMPLKDFYYLYFPRRMSIPHMGKHQVWSGGRRSKGKTWPTAFIVFSEGKERQGKAGETV